MKQVSGRNITMQCILGVSSLLIGVSGRLVASLHSPTFSLRSEVLLFGEVNGEAEEQVGEEETDDATQIMNPPDKGEDVSSDNGTEGDLPTDETIDTGRDDPVEHPNDENGTGTEEEELDTSNPTEDNNPTEDIDEGQSPDTIEQGAPPLDSIGNPTEEEGLPTEDNTLIQPLEETMLITPQAVGDTFNFSYNGAPQTFTAPNNGYYQIELRGAEGGIYQYRGGYTKGTLYLHKGETLSVYVGGKGLSSPNATTPAQGGWNGGGTTRQTEGDSNNGGGGGATDVRFEDTSLNARIMVAGGGAGAVSVAHSGTGYGGGLVGGSVSTTHNGSYEGYGGTQVAGGGFANGAHEGEIAKGSFGNGGRGKRAGGGGGYYGGGADWIVAGGGSSFISGYTGAVAIISATSTAPRTSSNATTCTMAIAATDVVCSHHYSNQIFTDAVMKAGNETMPAPTGGTQVGNPGNGYAKITILNVDTSAPVLTLNGSETVIVEVGASYTDQGAIRTDNYDGTGTVYAFSGSVNTGIVGEYVLYYRYIDADDNVGTITRTVKVVDTQKPVITLNGSGEITLEVHSNYNEQGAIVSDNYNTGISVVISGTVDTSKVGIYYVYYNATDTSNNQAEPKSRKINVVDTTKPVISLIGSGEITLQAGDTYIESGASVSDNYDTGISVVISGNVDTGKLGTQYVYYNATDSAGNKAMQLVRTVHIVDTTKPIITLNGSGNITLEVHSTYNEQGAFVSDNYSTGLSVVISGEVNTGKVGIYTITYNATDSAGNQAVQLVRTVNVVDTTKPIITLNGSGEITLEVHSNYNEQGASVSDNYSTGLSVITSGSVNTGKVGTYTITYNATDNAGNQAMQLVRTVNVVDTTKPVITLNGSGTITLEVHSNYTEQGASVSDNYSTGLSVVISGEVNTGTVGTYTITYNATDNAGNQAMQLVRTVHIVDTTKPSLTLNGSGTITLEVHSIYNEQGATVSDNYSTGLSVVISGEVNTGTVGIYTITYNTTDNAGNQAMQLVRTVNVVDTTKPIITLNGSGTITLEVHSNYNEQGATVSDNYSTGLSVIISGEVNTGKLGTYTLTYNATDNAGNQAMQLIRTVHIVDTTKPIITLNGSGTITLEVHSNYNEQGATVSDNYSTGLSVLISGEVNTGKVGIYTIIYNATDNAGNQAMQLIRTVNVVDTTKPIITLNGSGNITLEVHSTYNEQGAFVSDNYSTGLSVVISGNVNTGTVGTYTITYNATDNAGNQATQLVRTVNVVDTTQPSLTLIGSGDITLEVHSTFTDEGASRTDNYDGTGIVFAFSGSVDTGTVGEYLLQYRYIDTNHNTGNIVQRTVDIVDTTGTIDTIPPVIILNGEPLISILQHSVYTELGARWTDNYDGTGEVLFITGTVNTSVLGDYFIIYSHTDTAGNTDTATRTIKVIAPPEPLPPILPLPSFNQGRGGGGILLQKDYCPNGDFSPSYYDKTCEQPKKADNPSEHGTTETSKDTSNQAIYQRAKDNALTSMPTYEAFRANDTITRAEMAKVIVVFSQLMNASRQPLAEGQCTAFTDLNQTNSELQTFIIQACELGLMGYYSDGKTLKSAFKPNDTITLAEVATILSRMLRGTKHQGNEKWRYHNHLLTLQKAGIIPRFANPMRKELRGNVFEMMMKTANFSPTPTI